MSSRRTRRYTAEFKQEAIKLALNSPSIHSAAKDLGLPMSTLRTWIVQCKHLTSAKPKATIQQDMSNLLEENRRLAKEVARLKQEKEILKKAAAYFARESE